MKNNVVQTVLINLVVVVSLFIGFIFLDFNSGRAQITTTNSVSTLPASQGSVCDSNLSNKIPQSQTPALTQKPPFNFNPEVQYKEENVLSRLTNITPVVMSNGTTNFLTFYSLRARYYRFEVVKLILKTDKLPPNTYTYITRKNQIIPAYKGPQKLKFKKESDGIYTAYWMQGWNPPLENYKAVLTYHGEPVLARRFSYIARPQVKFNRLATFFNLEANSPAQKKIIISPNHHKVPYTEGLIKWMEYGDIDGFLNLSGETTGWNNVTPKKPWEYYPNYLLDHVGKAVHQTNRLTGAYIMCFYTPERGWVKAGYQSAKSVKYQTETSNFTIVNTKFASFSDKKRFDDIVALARDFNKRKHVDMIGFDFIRFGEKAGYENAAEFVRDMNIPVPAKWNRYSLTQKTLWLGIRLRYKKYHSFLKRWNLWKAHKTADFIYRVRQAAGITKPIWVFTLGWDHGTQHGQDPKFFLDAGVIADFVMLYEATPQMFEGLSKSWRRYLVPEKLNYIVGNQIDAVINRSLAGRNRVEEYYYRLLSGARYAPYGARGLFIHDSLRAFWGSRRGGYSTHEWMISAFSAVSRARYLNNEIPFSLNLPSTVSYTNKNLVKVPLTIHIKPDAITHLSNAQIKLEGIGIKYAKNIDIQGKSNIIISLVIRALPARKKFLAFRGKIKGYPVYFTFKYLNFKKKVPDVETPAVARSTNSLSKGLE